MHLKYIFALFFIQFSITIIVSYVKIIITIIINNVIILIFYVNNNNDINLHILMQSLSLFVFNYLLILLLFEEIFILDIEVF